MSDGVIILGNDISSGVFGKIVNGTFYKKPLVTLTRYEGKPLKNDTRYAIKVPKREDLQQEMDTLLRLGDSPYIIKLYGKATLASDNSMVLVMELLSATLGQRMKAAFPWKRTIFPKLLKNTFNAVAFLDSRKFVHRDLHYNNVMFANNNIPKLIDFGLAMQVEDKFVPFKMGPKEQWRPFHPPEQRMKIGDTFGYGRCTRKFDVYSMAMNMIEFVHDPSKDELKAPFDVLVRCAFLRSESANFSFEYLDARDAYPTPKTLYEDIIVKNSFISDACTHFKNVNGFPKLVLHMPERLGRLLKSCLMFEQNRPSAPEVLNAILRYEKAPLSQPFQPNRGAAASQTAARGLRGRGRGRGLSRGRGRGRGLSRPLKRKREKLRF